MPITSFYKGYIACEDLHHIGIYFDNATPKAGNNRELFIFFSFCSILLV